MNEKNNYGGSVLLKLDGKRSIETGDKVAAFAIDTCCSKRNAIFVFSTLRDNENEKMSQ
jgi:hypothetical protein